MIEVSPLRRSQEDEWDEFLRGTAGGLFAHSAAYRDLLIGELGCEAEYLVAREAGVIRGVMPVMWTGDGQGRICNSLPYHGSPGGPVAADERARNALLDAWNERATDPGTLAATMIENPLLFDARSEPVHGLTDERISQITVLADRRSEAEVAALISPEAKGNLRKAARRGVTVEIDNGAMEAVWRIHRETMAALGAPAKSRAFFAAIATRLCPGEDFDIWIARVGGEVAAALLVVRFNGVSEYFTSGTHIPYRRHNPHAAIVFAAMVHEARRGARMWNWGGTRHGMDGVFRFKRKWGSREGRYRYFVQVNDDSLLDARPEELVERFPGFYVVPFGALSPALA
jgi:hypothetical protein